MKVIIKKLPLQKGPCGLQLTVFSYLRISFSPEEVPCFFSLLREIFRSFPDSKANLQKVSVNY